MHVVLVECSILGSPEKVQILFDFVTYETFAVIKCILNHLNIVLNLVWMERKEEM